MNQAFGLNPIRKVGANGTIEAIGLEWTEEASWRRANMPVMLATGIPIAFGMLWAGYVMLVWGMGPWLLLLDAAFVGATIFYLFGRLPHRTVLLRRDGKVGVPHGLPDEKGGKFLKARQPDIIGFEIGPAYGHVGYRDWTSKVLAVTSTGGTVTISRYLHREEAREVVVGLNLALREMRASVGTEPMQRMRNVGPRILVD